MANDGRRDSNIVFSRCMCGHRARARDLEDEPAESPQEPLEDGYSCSRG
jgi:hypothetical protein